MVNTFVPNTTILSSAVNQNFTDIATGLSDCLTRDNQAGMTAIFRAVSGSVSAPGITFNSDTTAGLFLSTTGVVGLVAKSLGLIVNSAIYCMSTVAVQAGGSGYAVGDTITLTGGTAISQAVLTVATLSGSAVATATVTYPGFYTVKPSDPVAQGSTSGSGSSATFNITWVAQFSRSVVTNEAGALPWQRLGASSFVSEIMAKVNSYDFVKSILTIGSGISLSNSTSPATISASLNPTFVPNYIGGLTLSTAGSSTTMSISAGAANDSTNTTLMKLSSAISKTTATWAAGTAQGGLDPGVAGGAIANNTWYHFYQIENPSTGNVDVIFSTSASAPITPPSGYTLYRRIGSGRTNGSSQWTKFTQTYDTFILDTMVSEVGISNTATSRTNVTLTAVPTGLAVRALARISFNNTVASSQAVIFLSPQESDQAPTTTGPATLICPANGLQGIEIATYTNTSAQITQRATSATPSYSLYTYGWIDTRGK